MNDVEEKRAAGNFAQDWLGRGNEKSDTQSFWLSLLADVVGVKSVTAFIKFEKPVERQGHVGYIDAYIPSTKVLIEQKSLGVDLDKSAAQSGGKMLTPFEQAKEYANNLPYDERPRWIVVSDFATFRVYDMNHPFAAPEVIELKNLAKESHRLKFLVDMGADLLKREEEISLAAGRIIGELYDALLKLYGENPTEDDLRNLNVLCVRIVFCLYAEDAGILPKNAFHDYLNKFISSDIRVAMRDFFETLNTPIAERGRFLDPDLAKLPYVNGGLFGLPQMSQNAQIEADKSASSARSAGDIPPFSTSMRRLLLEKASLNFDWSAISPTIFGAVFESTLNPETRRKGGMHYTSVENIHKVIDPLFLDALRHEFREIVSLPQISQIAQMPGEVESRLIASLPTQRPPAPSPKNLRPPRNLREKLLAFQQKLASLTFLDPACGSGNFLTETYLSLRRLENEVLKIILAGQSELDLGDLVRVNIHQFYGIEINDFAVTVAKTALWIAESQMLKETEDILHHSLDFLPLKTYSNIVEANALTLDWESVVPRDRLTYIIGNPPFVGFTFMSAAQKADMARIFPGVKNLDFVCAWYKLANDYIRGTNIKCAFVSTNSITQGETVARFWDFLDFKIDFAWRTFRWDSESIGKAHVHCVIVGFSCREEPKRRGAEEEGEEPRSRGVEEISSARWLVGSSVGSSISPKTIFDEQGRPHPASNINAYLVDAPDIIVKSRAKPLCDIPPMVYGNKPADGGNLIIEDEDYANFIQYEPQAAKFIRPLLGATEYLHNKKRWCLWLVGADPSELHKCPRVMERIKKCREARLASPAAAIRKFALTPTLFAQVTQPEGQPYIIVPRVSSERRSYIPMSFMTPDVIVNDAVQIIPNATLYHFGVLTSSVHMAWMRAVCGRLKSDYRYSKDVVYNNFPWPEVIRNSDKSDALTNVREGEANRKTGEAVAKPSDESELKISQTAQAILDARARYPDSSLADLYDELTMPPDLRAAHLANDRAVLAAYGFQSASSAKSAGDKTLPESEIVAELMRRYQTLIDSR